MTDTKITERDLFTYGQSESASIEINKEAPLSPPSSEASKTDTPTVSCEKKPESGATFPFHIAVCFIFGAAITAALIYHGFIPDGLLNTLTDAAKVHSEAFMLDTLSFSSVSELAVSLSVTDLLFFSAMLILPCFVFRRALPGMLVFIRTALLTLSAVAVIESGIPLRLIAAGVTLDAVSAISYLVSAVFAVKFCKAASKDQIPSARIKNTILYPIKTLSAFGAAVISKAAAIIIVNLNF